MPLGLAKIVAELIHSLVARRVALKRGQDRLGDRLSGPAALRLCSRCSKQPDQAGVVMPSKRTAPRGIGGATRCNSGKSTCTLSHGAGGEASRDLLQSLAGCAEGIESLLQAASGQIVGADFIAQERQELLILLAEGVRAVGAQDMVAVLALTGRRRQLAFYRKEWPWR